MPRSHVRCTLQNAEMKSEAAGVAQIEQHQACRAPVAVRRLTSVNKSGAWEGRRLADLGMAAACAPIAWPSCRREEVADGDRTGGKQLQQRAPHVASAKSERAQRQHADFCTEHHARAVVYHVGSQTRLCLTSKEATAGGAI
eukprot:3399145-Pleurochrysis_carterae.AAC.2